MKISCPFCRSKVPDDAVVCAACNAEKNSEYELRPANPLKKLWAGFCYISFIGGFFMVAFDLDDKAPHDIIFRILGGFLSLGLLLGLPFILPEIIKMSDTWEIIKWHRNGEYKDSPDVKKTRMFDYDKKY